MPTAKQIDELDDKKHEVAMALLEKIQAAVPHNAVRFAVAYALVAGTLTSYGDAAG